MRPLKSLLNKARCADTRLLQFDDERMDLVIFPNKKWPRMGLILGNEALILDYRTMMSFRVKSGNAGFSDDIYVANCVNPINKLFLKKYFRENHDNPYGIQNIMNMIHRGVEVASATQLPPLFLPKLTGASRKSAIERLVGMAKKGDQVFSSHRTDAISAAIRKYDRSQFSHVATYLGDGKVADVGPGGGKINSLHDSDEDTHFALYTFKSEISAENRQAIVDYILRTISKVRFSYRGIFFMFLKKRFKLPLMRNIPSVADIIFSNSLDLVTFL